MDLLKEVLKKPIIRSRKKSKLFYRYLLSYLLIAVIPLFITWFILYNYFFNVLESEVKYNNLNTLTFLKNNVDNFINELNTKAYMIYSNEQLTSSQINKNPLKARDGIDLLKNYIGGKKWLDDIGIYYKNWRKICTSGNYSILRDFFYVHSDISNMKLIFEQYIKTVEKNMVLHVKNDELLPVPGKRIIYFVPFNNYYLFSDRLVFFLISENYFLEALKNYDGNGIIIDNNMQIIAASTWDDYLSSTQFEEFVKSCIGTDSATMVLNKTDYFTSYIKSDQTGWIYLSLTPVKSAMGKVISLKTSFKYVLSFVLVVIIIIILCAVKINYNPIKQLKIFTENKLGKNYAVNNEIDAIRLMIENVSNTATELNTKISNSKVAIKDFLLSSLIKGNFVDIEEFNIKARDINICFNHNMLYYVAIFLIESINNEDYSNQQIECIKLIELLEKGLPDDMQGYGISGIDKDRIIFIAATHHKNKRAIKDAMIQLQQNLRDFYGIHTFIGVGGMYTPISQIGKSYIEASIATDYRLIKGKGKVLFFNEVNFPSSDITDYPLKEINILKTSIINGDIDKTSQALSDLLSVIKDTNTSITTARCLCYDVINTIIKSTCIINKECITLQKKCFDLSSVVKFETVEELCETLKEISYEICSYINNYRKKDVQNFTDNIVSYIKNNYCNYNFSVQNMASHFGMSLSNLSHYFKQETGQTITDYVDYLRIEKAKELLISKNDTLQIIVENIGYCDASSFIRKFRKVVGMTPGEYRKIKSCTS